MEKFLDFDAWREALTQSFVELAGSVQTVLPSVLVALAIAAIGWLVAKILEWILRGALRGVGLDAGATRLGVAATLERAGIAAAPSTLLARVIFWLILLSFGVSALRALRIEAVSMTVERLIAFLPDVFAASVVFGVGLLFARFVGTVVSSLAAAADLEQAPRLGAGARAVTVLLVVVIALEQLGVESGVVLAAIAALLAAAGIAVGVAFALGARPIVTHILAGHFLRQSLLPETTVEVQGRRGVVDRIGPTDTLIRDGDRAWSVPNGTLLEEIVSR